jgi:hypothetical protein
MAQAEHTLLLLHELQKEMGQNTHLPLLGRNVLLQEIHVFEELQLKQLVTLQVKQVPLVLREKPVRH